MYNPIIVKHFSNPLNVGELETKDHVIKTGNPVCDDRIEMHIRWNEKQEVTNVKYRAFGCATSIATASIFSEFIEGKSPAQICATEDAVIQDLLGPLEPNQEHCLDILFTLFRGFENLNHKHHSQPNEKQQFVL